MSGDPPADWRLVREVQRGSADALEELFRREWPRAYRAAYLIVHGATAAEDIAQEAFLAAVRAIDRFDRRRPFGPWMHRIVVNRAIDVTRARALRREVDAAAADSAQARPDPPSTPLSDDVVSALARLSPEHRAVIVLRFLLTTHPARSPAPSTCRAAPSTHACAARSIGWPRDRAVT